MKLIKPFIDSEIGVLDLKSYTRLGSSHMVVKED